jgi:RluA family pseudouridine synthase
MSEVYKKFSPELYEAVYKVDEEHNGLRLDQYCATFLGTWSRQAIKKKIKDGEIKIFDRPFPHKPSVKVYHREKIEIKTLRGSLEDEYWNGKKISLQLKPDIVFEDEDLIVISKPSYMATHPTGRHLFNCATVFFEHKYNKTIHSIHRLDRETSGVLLLAKNTKAAHLYTSLFEKDQVSKCYFFIGKNTKKIDFPLTANERLGVIDDYIPRNFNHCFNEDSNEGKHAQTTFIDLYSDDNYIIGLAFPKTGRQHQIRCHAAAHGFPLVGDKLYNGDPRIFMRFKDLIPTKEDHELMEIPRHALHALALKTKSSMEEKNFRAPLPNDFIAFIETNIPKANLQLIENLIDKKLKEKFT